MFPRVEEENILHQLLGCASPKGQDCSDDGFEWVCRCTRCTKVPYVRHGYECTPQQEVQSLYVAGTTDPPFSAPSHTV